MTKAPSSNAPRRMRLPDKDNFYRAVGGATEPLIFESSMHDWPAMQQWDFDWFVSKYGDQKMPVEWLSYIRAEAGTHATRKGRREELSLRDAVARFRAGGDDAGYLIGMEMYQRLPELLAALRFPELQAQERLTKRLFFMGGVGAFTQLHFDRAENMHAVFRGRKRWQLWGPDAAGMNPTELEFVWSVASANDLGREHFEEAEQVGLPRPELDFVLEAGEILYLPYGWWHRVVTVEDSIATNYWWWTLPMLLRHGPSIVPSAARIAWRARSARPKAAAAARV